MKNEEFIKKAKQLVTDYTNDHMDKTDGGHVMATDVYVVWLAKTLQNAKALLSTTVSDGMYYEATLDGDKGKIYLDAYKKFENVAHDVEKAD